MVSICCMPRSELAVIKQHFGNRPFRVREAVEIGIPRHRIYRLRDEGVLVVLSRGVMQSIESDPAMNTEFAALAARVPDGSICLSSGLSYWELSDELPTRIDLAVPRGAHWPKIDTPATRLHRFAAETFRVDRLAQHTDAGEPFSIYSAPRCIVDAMRLPHLIGRDVALAALSRYLRQAGADPLRLTALARQLGGGRRIREALEVILA
jgi:predicted transcriptional regulator of viral defense system